MSVPEVKRDRWGRYLLPHPETGKEQAWTRASTIAKTMADNFALSKWMQRNLAFGIGKREDLYAKAASVASVDEKDTLNKIIDEALEAAASASGANFGTALHRFTERIDNGEKVEVPDQWKADVSAYVDTMKAEEVKVVPGWTEVILVLPELGIAGTTDRLLECAKRWALPKIGDLKTGKVVEYAMNEIAIQEAIYANATHWWNPLKNEYEAMPEIDKDTAIVMHLPVGQAKCTLYEVDIKAGYEALHQALWVRDWRKRNDLGSIVGVTKPKKATRKKAEPKAANATSGELVETTPEVIQASLEDRLAWLRARVKYVMESGQGQELAEVWNASCQDVPTFRHGGPTTHEQIDRVAAGCNIVETAHQLPFFEPDPTNTLKENNKNKKVKELAGL